MTKHGAFFRRLRAACGMTQDEFAKLAGVSAQAVSQWENGKSAPSFESFADLSVKVAELLGTTSVLELGTQAPTPLRQINVLFGEPGEAVEVPRDYGPTCFAVRLADDSMAPQYRRHDLIVLDPTVSPAPGDMVLAELDGGAPLFRKYTVAGYDQDGAPIIALSPLNPDWPELRMDASRPGKILGTLIEHRTYGKRR
jgi:transcriptional regulator with XRE-family HTH domain